jgi:hypothetical protein
MRPLFPPKATTTQDRNFHLFVMDILWFGIALASTMRFLSAYAIRLGANTEQINLLTALPSLVLALSMGLSIAWVKAMPNTVMATFWPGLGFRFLFLFPALTPFLPSEWQLTWLIATASIIPIPQALATVSFLGMFRQSVKPERMGPLLSTRSFWLHIMLGGAVLAYGYWLDMIPFPLNYQIMFLFSFVFALVSIENLIWIRTEPALEIAPTAQRAANPWADRNFWVVIVVCSSMCMAYNVVQPITNEHLMRGLQANETFLARFGLLELAAAAAMSPLVLRLRLHERLGNRRVMALGMFGLAAAALLLAKAPALEWTYLAAALTGASWALVSLLTMYQFFNEHAPADADLPYAVAYQQVVAFGMFLGPMLGNLLVHNGINLVNLLLAGAAVRLLVSLCAALWQGDTVATPPKPQRAPAVGD